jgi:predicted Zn-dependent protease
MLRILFPGVAVLLFLCAWSTVSAAACKPEVGRFVSVEGKVELRRGNASGWQKAALDSVLCRADTVRAGRNSRAAISLVNDAVLRVDSGTTLRLLEVSGVVEEPSLIDVIRGAIKSFSRKPRLIKVNSPYLNGTIEGTEFQLRVVDGSATLTVLEGLVLAANEAGSVRVGAGQAASAAAGQAPQLRTLVRPGDAVQWTLHYPPVLASLGGAGSTPDSLSRPVRRALESAARNDMAAAFDELERTPSADRDAGFFVHRAALSLSVGRVEAAEADIDRAQALTPDNSLGLALRAVIGVLQNRREEALADGQRAVERDPSAAARIALSYAQQASFQIEAARANLRTAVSEHPADALAWARLGELELMLGNREQASDAAAEAERLAPDLARAKLVRGFTALAELRKDDARAAFERAVALRSADPLAHLGLGLVETSLGDIAAGRQRLEVAVALDSGNALLRSYLGKAYFGEKRSPLDAEQFRISRELDPLDPTAYLYGAIAKQTENRPVEALDDLEGSIERNDNRAVYRSRLLLDEDRAARGTSLARVHNDLGFNQLGVNESTRSLTDTPGDASAHRFLSDSYRAQPRREVARVSELLQSQLFQDLNINPVQPSIAATNLNIVSGGGPASPGFNEFTPLFQQNQAQFNVSGFAGSNHTRGGEAVLSGVFDQVSFSGGGYAFNSDGFRDNNDLQHRIADAFAQVALTPTINLQGELRQRETDRGDIAMNFDPQSFSANLRRTDEELTRRIGLRFSPSPATDIIASTIFADRERGGSDRRALPPEGEITRAELTELTRRDDESEQYEVAFVHKAERFNLIAGGAYSRVKSQGDLSAVLDFTADPAAFLTCVSVIPPNTDFVVVPAGTAACVASPFLIGPVPVDPPPVDITDTQVFPLDQATDDYRGYGYVNVDVVPGLTESELIDFQRWNPKLGVQWEPNRALRLRAAYFKVVKPVLASNRVLEPTQIAGFNQLFDDADSTRSTGIGVGADWRVTTSVYAGFELTGRDIDHPNINLVADTASFQDRDERYHRAYLYWTPTTRWSVGLEGIYDQFKNSTPSSTVPREVVTRSLPLKLRYFHPSGFFADLGATYVRQKVVRENSTLAQGRSSFGVVDLTGGYRLGKRMGVLSLSVQNLFDREMKFQDDSFRTFGEEPSGTPFTPERTVMGRFTLSF